MDRLIDNELIYGDLMPVSRSHMVERYNAALGKLGVKPTGLSAFSVDATGFSPDIAREFDDAHYLDPHGVNRRFIILSPEQGSHPVLQVNFSSTTDLMQMFYARNIDAIRMLTLKDAMYGEIENSTYRVGDIDDILAIKKLEFRVRTVDGLLKDASELDKLVTRFHSEDDSWRDDAMLNRIAELADKVGDIRRHNPVPQHVDFGRRSFWTRHFGGLYVFHEEDGETVVIGYPLKREVDGTLQTSGRYFSLQKPALVYNYLVGSGRLEETNFEWLESSPLLDSRIDTYVRQKIAEAHPDVDLLDVDDTWVRNWVHDNFSDLSKDGIFPALLRLRTQVRNRATLPKEVTKGLMRFTVVRAEPEHSENALVNRLVSELVPFDYLMRFIYNKEAFHVDYAGFLPSFRAYVEHVIKTRYLPDPLTLTTRLFH